MLCPTHEIPDALFYDDGVVDEQIHNGNRFTHEIPDTHPSADACPLPPENL